MATNSIQPLYADHAASLGEYLRAELPPGLGFGLFIFEQRAGDGDDGQGSHVTLVTSAEIPSVAAAMRAWLEQQES